MALEHERQRIIDFVNAEKERRLPEMRQLVRHSSHLRPFVELTETFYSTLDRTLASRLEDTANTIGAISIDAASQRLSDLSRGLEATTSLIRTIAANQGDIPRELYRLVSWFFDRCAMTISPPLYVLSVSTDLSTLEFRQWLSSLFSRPVSTSLTRDIYPELITTFANQPFFFILVPASMASTTSAIDWPLVFHECVHAVEELAGVVGSLFPGVPRNWEVLQLRAQAGDTTAREALWTLELACDFVASHVTGPCFLWRFLRRYFSLLGVFHQSFSHPTFDVRMKQLTALLREHGFDSEAAQAEVLVNEMAKDVGGLSALPAPASLAASVTASKQYTAKIAGFNQESFQKALREQTRSDRPTLLNDLIAKRPVVADPATLFTIVAFEPQAESPLLASRLADFLRLYDVQSAFRRLRLSG